MVWEFIFNSQLKHPNSMMQMLVAFAFPDFLLALLSFVFYIDSLVDGNPLGSITGEGGRGGMGCRVGVTVFFALFAIVTAVLPNWTWWAYSGTYTGFLIFDHLVGWTMTGFVLGKMMPKNHPEPEAEEPVPAGAEAD